MTVTGPDTLGGRYTLVEVLGAGGMATVWRARDEVLGREVALKELRGWSARPARARARFQFAHLRRLALDHPGLAPVHGADCDRGWLVLDYFPEGSLADRESTAESIEEALISPPPGENKVRLDKKAIETYPQRFWGNIDDLRSKVLQSLNRKEEDFDKRLLRVQDIAYALKFFHGQIWRYQ